MPARLLVYLPDGPALCRWLQPDQSLTLGRGADAELRLEHRSISRQHAQLQACSEGWLLLDQASKNGCFVDGERCTRRLLDGSHWLRLGELHGRFEVLPARQQSDELQRRQRRQALSQTLGEQLPATAGHRLLDDTVRAAAALAECDRAYLLLADGELMRVGAAFGGEPGAGSEAGFAGSQAAIARAVDQRRPVVVNDTRSDSGLAGRASIIRGRIRALLAVPLVHHDAVLGVLYADRQQAEQPINQFDLDLVAAFAERATLWIATRQRLLSLEQLPAFGHAGRAA